MAAGKREDEGAQAAVDDLHAGSALQAALARLLKGPDDLDRAGNQHQRRAQEPKHQQTGDDHGAPALL